MYSAASLPVNTLDTALHHQRLVQDVQRLRAEVSHLEGQLVGDAETARLSAAVAEARAHRRELEHRLREVDRETEDRRERAAARERELMSGRITDPNGLLRLRAEVDHLKEALSGAEDAELALLEDAEREDAELRALERALQQRTAGAASAAPERERRLAAATARLRTLEAEARSTWELLPADLQQTIGQIKEHHADALAEVHEGQCLGCHVAVTSTVGQALRHGGLVTCDNCGRLLVGR